MDVTIIIPVRSNPQYVPDPEPADQPSVPFINVHGHGCIEPGCKWKAMQGLAHGYHCVGHFAHYAKISNPPPVGCQWCWDRQHSDSGKCGCRCHVHEVKR